MAHAPLRTGMEQLIPFREIPILRCTMFASFGRRCRAVVYAWRDAAVQHTEAVYARHMQQARFSSWLQKEDARRVSTHGRSIRVTIQGAVRV
jgi:molybdopterin-guanine dinucleotide biosynthesis protein A